MTMFEFIMDPDKLPTASGLSDDSRAFVRRFKQVGLGQVESWPDVFDGSGLEPVTYREAEKAGFPQHRCRIEAGFYNAKRCAPVVDDMEIVTKLREFFELDDHSTSGDRVRNIVQVFGMDTQRRYLKSSVDSLLKKFKNTYPIVKASLSALRRIVVEKLRHLTTPNESDRKACVCSIHLQAELYIKAMINACLFDLDDAFSVSKLGLLGVCNANVADTICMENLCGKCENNLGLELSEKRLIEMVFDWGESREIDIEYQILGEDEYGKECKMPQCSMLQDFVKV